MKKIAKIMGAALISAAMLASVSCSKKSESKSAAAEALAKVDVTNEEEFTKFDSYDFKGDWIVGEWECALEKNMGEDSGSSTSKITITADGKATVEADGQVATMRVSDVKSGLFSAPLPSTYEIDNMKNAGVTIEGKPYFVINKAKTIIALNFSASKDGETNYLKAIMKKAGAEDTAKAEAAPAEEKAEAEDADYEADDSDESDDDYEAEEDDDGYEPDDDDDYSAYSMEDDD